MDGEDSYDARCAHPNVHFHASDHNFSASHRALGQKITVPPNPELPSEDDVQSSAHPSYDLIPSVDPNMSYLGELLQGAQFGAGNPADFPVDFPSDYYLSTTYNDGGDPECMAAYHRDPSDPTLPISSYSELSRALGTHSPSRPGSSDTGSLQQFASVSHHVGFRFVKTAKRTR
ncbi:hypothetical protein PAXRUDRAFT_162620 [Paxillus rubicundulus Ve08.2h10]|uniref:Uncharacterized protein n=1 Tax=Paxillus rubicundulus Ve08.2h10 TaxID=930991 RepID=A0A0D0D5S2_9AGAM|nr:hypothetical protein PAXRUDRAFT_162620 [Paxillus rubicundulus Ve08.2h10]